MKTITEFNQRLITLNACVEARNWADGKTAAEAWEQCEKGDWLLWWAAKENTDLRQLTLAKARCAKLVIHLMSDERSIKAVEAAENFGLGLIDLEDLNAAAAAAAAAAYAVTYEAYRSGTAYAAWVANHASYCSDISFAMASSAYSVPSSAANAEGNVAIAATIAVAPDSSKQRIGMAEHFAKKRILFRCTEIIRENIKPNFL